VSVAKLKLLGGRWQITGSLGEGGQAHTFRVRDVRDGSEAWVLKRLKNLTRLGRFEREISALARLSSQHIPQIVDYSLDDPPFLVTPYVGTDLTKASGPRPSLTELLHWYRQIVVAAHDAHTAGLVHRDVKPDNVVVSAEGTVYLVDFGICSDERGKVVLTTTTEGFGNRAFAAPECEPGSGASATPKSDVYSLGKLLYWMTSGHRFMVREQFDPHSLDIADKCARHYVARLIRETVKADPHVRWTTSDLLDGIDWVLAKLDEHRALCASDLIVVIDHFGPNYERYPSGSRSATTPPRGDPPADHDLAEAFPTGPQPTRLARLEVALRLHGGNGRASVALTTDDAGRPSGRVLDGWQVHVTSSGEGEVVRLESQVRTVLRPRSTYWICLSAIEPDSDVAWISGSINLMPLLARFAERDMPEEWRAAESSSGPGHALRVLAYPLTDRPPFPFSPS
jgi:serine/threonine protein kinase